MNLLKTAVIFVSIILFLGCSVVVEETAPGPGGKKAICHKGKKTIYVDDAAVKAHLGHGDYMGPCR